MWMKRAAKCQQDAQALAVKAGTAFTSNLGQILKISYPQLPLVSYTEVSRLFP